MTVRERIHEFLSNGVERTASDIAFCMNLPAPSVRRALVSLQRNYEVMTTGYQPTRYFRVVVQ